jgi:heptosyltransferase-2
MTDDNLYNPPNCLKFTGYRPCAPYMKCEECEDPRPVKEHILVVSLEAQGAVLMSTALLHAIKQEYPESYLVWLTRQEAMPLLENNQLIDRALPWNDENRLLLGQVEFDIVYSLDKSAYTGAFVNSIKAAKKRGFGVSPQGQIIPLNRGALYNYRLGLDDAMKFHENKRPVVDVLHETVELPYNGQRYSLKLTPEEIDYKNKWAQKAGLSLEDIIIGVNTGCSHLFPNKKMTVDQHVSLIKMLHGSNPGIRIILLGGHEDTERNNQIQDLCGDLTVNTPTTEGLRRGIMYMDVADIVVSGDSLGMHLAVGLGKYVVVWFGLSCAEEIELYGRGEKIVSGVSCEPCWKKSCDDLKCIQELPLQKIHKSVCKGITILAAEKSTRKT